MKTISSRTIIQSLLYGWFAMGGLVVCGCDMLPLHDTVKNPVVGPPPARISMDDTQSNSTSSAGVVHLGEQKPERSANIAADLPGESRSDMPPQWKKAGSIEQVGYQEAAKNSEPRRLSTLPADASPIPDTHVAATVNGVPILVGEVLEPFGAGLATVAKKAKPEEMREFRRELVRRNLKTYVELQLLINAMKSSFKEEQLASIDKQLDKMFAEELQKLYKHYRVSTVSELDAELQKQHTSLQAIRTTFRNNKMAQQYMAYKAGLKDNFDRKEMVAWYHEHQADYEISGQVKWQQILISSTEQGNEEKALKTADKLLDEMEQGAAFDALARKHSAGPTASKGGVWDWTRQGSFADQEFEKLLFELPVGEISGPHKTKQGIQIVQVLERKDGSRKSFESVQDEIRKKLQERQFREGAEQLMNKLRDQAVIETMFDGEEKKAPG